MALLAVTRERLSTEALSFAGVLFGAICGLLIGSFLNVCIYRIPRDLSVVRPRSFCPECERSIASWDNIPVVSYLLLRGRCRHCESRIQLRYPLVELFTASLFAAVLYRFGWSSAALKWMVFEALLMVLFWTDFETEILPDELTLGGTAAVIVFDFFVPLPGICGELAVGSGHSATASLINSAVGALVLAAPIWLVGAIFSRLWGQAALGFGDVKLLVLLGSFLGLESGFQTLTAGAVVGAVTGGVWTIYQRKKPLTQSLRFGCFLCGAAAFMPFLNKIEGM